MPLAASVCITRKVWSTVMAINVRFSCLIRLLLLFPTEGQQVELPGFSVAQIRPVHCMPMLNICAVQASAVWQTLCRAEKQKMLAQLRHHQHACHAHCLLPLAVVWKPSIRHWLDQCISCCSCCLPDASKAFT